MSKQNSRIPDSMVADILGEAARLHAETTKGYSLADLEKICEEAHIPPQLVKKALQNIEEKQFRQNSQRQQLQKYLKAQAKKGIIWGLALGIPVVAISGIALYRSQMGGVITGMAERIQPTDEQSALQEQQASTAQQLTSLTQAIADLQEKLVAFEKSQKVFQDNQKLLQKNLADRQPPQQQLAEPQSKNQPQPTVALKPGKMLREDFRQRVMGKSEQEVLAAVGRPKETSDLGTLTFWDYGSIHDPWSGKEGPATVIFKDGVVYKVRFS